jgi:hypothetical protein
MIHPKPIETLAGPDGARSELTPRTFGRAAGLANLIVVTTVIVEFSVLSLVEHDPKTFQMGLWLVPVVTLVVWVIAAVLCLLALVPRGLRVLGRRRAGRSRSPRAAESGVWDDWLDSPTHRIADPVRPVARCTPARRVAGR